MSVYPNRNLPSIGGNLSVFNNTWSLFTDYITIQNGDLRYYKRNEPIDNLTVASLDVNPTSWSNITNTGSGYVGECRIATLTLTNRSNGVNLTGNPITLTDGIWMVQSRAIVFNVAPTFVNVWTTTSIGGNAVLSNINGGSGVSSHGQATGGGEAVYCTTGQQYFQGSLTLYPACRIITPASANYSVSFEIKAIRVM